MDTAPRTTLPPVDPPELDEDGGGDGAREPRWARPLVAVLAVIGLLLIGGAGGMLLAGGFRTAAAPDAVDVGFLQDMSAHHQQAVEMAGWERDHTTDPVLGQLAGDIEFTQNNQVGRMQGWLEMWGESGFALGNHMTWMSGADMAGHAGMGADPSAGVTQMPGMASSEDLAAMRAATGTELDVLWLQLMLRHHEGGASMLQYASTYAATPQVRNLANQMLAGQTSEIQFLEQLLSERGGTPLPL